LYFLQNGTYFYKISFIEANDDENSKNVYPTVETFVKSGSFSVSNFGVTGTISMSLPSNYAPLMNNGDILPVNLNINATKQFLNQ
jgi:hypothetical protein